MNVNEYKDILRTAIKNEVEAYEFYKNAAEKVEDNNLKSTFMDLANEEVKHQVSLKEFLTDTAREIKFDEKQTYGVYETIEGQKLSTEMNFKDAIALAMKKEQEAMDMYQRFADLSVEAEQKGIFEELVKMEKGHKARLEDIYTNAAYIEVW